ncbi:sulfotransferase family protein [Tolypothrix sp. PCC 7910]|uniref:sulfotransferase family protein n=1 Tax=Tolypothrix sp. PCC 7910 TaxID=2099387 RepID=UPI0014279732|nr:sulfotransferase [Tolypothrix sp. PCC 7910]QIR37171.1 sulfotransferase family protein [Tolypothrix sp. PCC 7910]
MIDQLEKSISHYQKALVIKYDNAAVHRKLGQSYEIQTKIEQAIYHYIKAIQFDPSHFQTYWKLKFCLLKLDCLPKTIDSSLLEAGISTLRQSTQLQPNFHFAHTVLGNLLTQQGKIEEAIACYQTASYKQTLLSYPELVEKHWNHHQKRQPDFLITGFMKSGTTSLYSYLSSHPQILPAVDKALRFFTDFLDQGLDWYLAHFPAILDSRNYLTGEATPIYINFTSLASKIYDCFPNIKLIILLRHPVQRAISSYYHQHQAYGHYKLIQGSTTNTIEKVLTRLHNLPSLLLLEPSILKKNSQNDYIDDILLPHLVGSLYIYYIKQWLNIFPKEQILIIKSEDLYNNPSVTMKQVYDFLKLPHFQLSEYRNSNPGSYPPISNELRSQLVDFFRPYNQQLEEYLGMSFKWD